MLSKKGWFLQSITGCFLLTLGPPGVLALTIISYLLIYWNFLMAANMSNHLTQINSTDIFFNMGYVRHMADMCEKEPMSRPRSLGGLGANVRTRVIY